MEMGVSRSEEHAATVGRIGMLRSKISFVPSMVLMRSKSSVSSPPPDSIPVNGIHDADEEVAASGCTPNRQDDRRTGRSRRSDDCLLSIAPAVCGVYCRSDMNVARTSGGRVAVS